MGKNLTKEQREEIARAKFKIIAPLLRTSGEERASLIKEISKVPHDIPFSKKKEISVATFYRWIEDFEKGGGVAALMKKERSDKGKSRVMDEILLSELKDLKKELPRRSVRKLIRMVELGRDLKEGLIKEPTLSRILREQGYTRWVLSSKPKKARKKWQRALPNSLWMGDFMTADIWLPHPEDGGKIKQLHFCGYLDDRSRLCPHGEFFFNEKLPCLEITFKKALSKRGIPDEVYYDGGKTFQSDQMKAICYELGINPIDAHSAESRGKIEKFIQFVQTDFIAEIVHAGVKTLAEVNTRFLFWLEQDYHKKVNREIGECPIDAWNEIKNIRTVTPEKLEQVFLWRDERKVSPTRLISNDGNSYETKPELANKKVHIRFNPFDYRGYMSTLTGNFIQRLNLLNSYLSRIKG
ncbi:Mu transposase C-terminal domain-containing protein [candidate division NPL-UPA2 bacterium]|nr:Mu transposase C-terminal domain-containing protein [candidate division NPL-UPA2 bacterium]